MTEKALNGTARKLHLVVGRYDNRDAIFEIRAARSFACRLKCRKCLRQILLFSLRVAQYVIFQIKLIVQVEKERSYFVGEVLQCLF